MTTARCLCGDVTWELEGPLRGMRHCHCSRCRKAHGSAYATYVGGPSRTFRLLGEQEVVAWESTPGFFRRFCGRCGSVVPSVPVGDLAFVPAGNFDVDPGARPEMHLFVGSKAPWFELTDQLPRFDTFPADINGPIVPSSASLEPSEATRGSCLCGGVAFVVRGEAVRCWNCHCTRCQRSRSAAFATNLVTKDDGVEFTRGADLVSEYKVPDARHYRHAFCRLCGSSAPRIDRARGMALVPMGSMDDDAGIRPTAHIFAGAKAPWDALTDALPRYDEYPPR